MDKICLNCNSIRVHGEKFCSHRCQGEFRRKIAPPEKRFWQFVDKTSSPSGCWLWIGAKNKDGYGSFQSTTAHRFSWMIIHGQKPPYILICHNCPGKDNPACVNPAHLFEGSNTENQRDAAKKGCFNQKGEMNNAVKLTDDQVRQIFLLSRSREKKQLEISKQFNISQSTVSSILMRRIRKEATISIS